LRYYKKLHPQGRIISFNELLGMAEDGDELAAKAVEKQAHFIGRGLQPIIAGLAPSVILVAGDITSAWHRYGSIIEKEAAALTLVGMPPRILPTHDGDVARLRGAAALVFQRRAAHEEEVAASQDRPPRSLQDLATALTA
jgi:predicted NBD/HSP70 family sugar kinase